MQRSKFIVCSRSFLLWTITEILFSLWPFWRSQTFLVSWKQRTLSPVNALTYLILAVTCEVCVPILQMRTICVGEVKWLVPKITQLVSVWARKWIQAAQLQGPWLYPAYDAPSPYTQDPMCNSWAFLNHVNPHLLLARHWDGAWISLHFSERERHSP